MKNGHVQNFLHKCAQIAKALGNKVSKMFDRAIYNKKASLIVSGVFAVIFCVSISFDDLRVQLFGSDVTTWNITNVPVEVLMDSDNYEVSGLPSTADVSIEGDATDIQLVRAQNSTSVRADLRNLAEGPNTVILEAVGVPSGLDVSVNPSSAQITLTKKETRTYFITPELMVGAGQSKSDFQTPVLSANSVSIKATKQQLDSIRVVKAIIDTSGKNADFVIDAPLVAYDSSGKQINVSMQPDTVTATVRMASSNNAD